ncbi:MAG: Hpt domain-containing protein [Anaeroplasmataceae bacterium]|nr:Hpt domain-containing protein [Anaeroplasmataceae bacterium]MDE5868384.1 Hpt domain-containing protein [Anaeroplasmataceae bacterium]
MTENVKQMLEAAGLDVTATLGRLGNQEAFYQKFLKMFLADTNYEQLVLACDAKDNEQMFKAAHTLKGLSANLGLKDFNMLCCQMVDLYRENKFEEARDVLPSLTEKYQLAREAITKYLG